jgi:hypothetical protein
MSPNYLCDSLLGLVGFTTAGPEVGGFTLFDEFVVKFVVGGSSGAPFVMNLANLDRISCNSLSWPRYNDINCPSSRSFFASCSNRSSALNKNKTKCQLMLQLRVGGGGVYRSCVAAPSGRVILRLM